MGIEQEGRTVVYLGNRDAYETVTDHATGQRITRELPGKRCTTVKLTSGMPLLEAAAQITGTPHGVWGAHSTGTPAWVASSDPALAQLLAAHYKCELREPDPDHVASGDGQE